MSISVAPSYLLGVPTYQWYFNGSAINGATSATLTLANVSVQNIGSYYAQVSDLLTMDSSTATLTVTDLPPRVNNDAYSCLQNASLAVVAPGVLSNDAAAFAGPLTAMLVTNVTHGTLVLKTNGGFTYLPATNYYGSDSFSYIASDGMSNSAPATVNLTILAPPSITTQPQSQQVVTNQNATFSVAVTGTTPLSYQWYLQGSVLSGATNATLIVSNVLDKNVGKYWVVVTNIAGSVTSTQVYLTDISLPTISSLSASSVSTNSATFSASVKLNGGATTVYFQYGATTNYGYFSETNYEAPGAEDAVTASVTGLSPGTVYHYSVVAVNAAGTTTSADSTFTTAFLPPKVVFLHATNVTAGSVTFKARVNPEGSDVRYYFQFGVTTNFGFITATNALSAATNGTEVVFPVAGLVPGTTYFYNLVAINAGGTTVATNMAFATLTIPPIQFTGNLVSGASGPMMQLTLTSVSGASFTVLESTDVSAPVASWTVLGSMTEVTSGQYQFNDSNSVTNPSCFYRIESQ